MTVKIGHIISKYFNKIMYEEFFCVTVNAHGTEITWYSLQGVAVYTRPISSLCFHSNCDIYAYTSDLGQV